MAVKVAACEPILTAEQYKRGVSLWHCKRCNGVTEHVYVQGDLECTVCGFSKRKAKDVKAKQREYFQRPDVKAKKREYFQRPDVKAKQREYFQRPDVKAKKREYFQRPDVKAKQREYSQRPDVKAKKRARKRQRQIERLEKKLQALRMEVS